jgi:hypothetical protein
LWPDPGEGASCSVGLFLGLGGSLVRFPGYDALRAPHTPAEMSGTLLSHRDRLAGGGSHTQVGAPMHSRRLFRKRLGEAEATG